MPLLERLPKVKGRLTENAPLTQLTWFRVGGPAEILFKPADQDDLIFFLRNCPADILITVLGVASNTIIRDGGVQGVVIRLGREFAQINTFSNFNRPNSNLTTCHPSAGWDLGPNHTDVQVTLDPSLRWDDNLRKIISNSNKDGTGYIECGAGALDLNVAMAAREAGLAGLEFLSGIPGTIGGALRMNAGAYAREMKDCLVAAEAIDRQGKLHQLTLDDMQFAYRKCGIPSDWIFTRAILQGTLDDPVAIQARMDDIKSAREESQPVRARTGGSTFANPENNKAWQLIDEAGCRGLRQGGAQMSELHCNFMINNGDATAADLETLGEKVRATVMAKSGITLEWEIKRIGISHIHEQA